MTFTANDLIPLKEALLTGASSVSISGRTVMFRSVSELKKLISEIESSIAAQEAAESEEILPFINPNKIQATFKK